ncbi:MAG: 1-deoxy-D-xylulose-5-phosphate synthase [bacterium]
MPQLLGNIELPKGLKKLSISELEKLAHEVREEIVDTVSKNGGHLSSSLGAVDLAIALHTVFDSPKDKLIWDVGHQAYAHKIITSRYKKFHTLRQYGGISGFLKRDESVHDIFGAGHASTSISAALGIAKARDLQGEHFKVVSIIGDASLAGGLALEGLNSCIGMKTNLIVILNDNEMSISSPVGALSRYTTQIRINPAYIKIKERVDAVIKGIPRIGVPLSQRAERLKDRFKHFFVDIKAGVMFEEFGFKYLGPIDGSDISFLIHTLHYAKEVASPVLIHVGTKKGRGYAPAEKEPTKFHGVGPFNKYTGEAYKKNGNKSYTEVFGNAMAKLAEDDPKIIAITAAMIDGTGLEEFAKRFPKRFFDVGITEEHATVFAAGLATQGFKPVVAVYSTFLQRAYDQIIHDVALQKLPVTFCLDRAGLVGEDGATHQGVFDMAFLRHIPNMVVMAPKDENELQNMLFTALRYHEGPTAIRYPRGAGLGIPMDKKMSEIPIGCGEVVYKGKKAADVLIIAIGNMVYPSIEAAKKLDEQKIGAKVINARFVKPLDEKLIIKSIKGIKHVITAEEGALMGGFGSAVLEMLQDHDIKAPVTRIGLPDEFIEHGAPQILRDKYGLTAEGIAEKVSKIVLKK